LKTIGHSLKIFGPSQKTLRYPCCPNQAAGMIGHSLTAGYGPGRSCLMD